MVRMKASDRLGLINIEGAGHRRHDGSAPLTREGLRRRLVDPRVALAKKLIKAKRIGSAGIARVHFVKEFGEYCPHIGFADLLFL